MKESAPSSAQGPDDQAAQSRDSDSGARPPHAVGFGHRTGTLTTPSGWLVVVLVIAGICALAWQWRVAHSAVRRSLPVELREPQSY